MKNGLWSAACMLLVLSASNSFSRPNGLKIRFIQAWLKKSRNAIAVFEQDTQTMRTSFARAYCGQAENLRAYHPAGNAYDANKETIDLEARVAYIPLVNQSYGFDEKHAVGADS